VIVITRENVITVGPKGTASLLTRNGFGQVVKESQPNLYQGEEIEGESLTTDQYPRE